MNAIIFKQIQDTADNFAKIAKRVNISSRLRTKHSKEALVCISYILSIVSIVFDDIHNIAEKNITQKNSDLDILITYESLKKDNKELSETIDLIEKEKLIDNKILLSLKLIQNDFESAIDQALDKLQEIVERDTSIIVMDEEIQELKKDQKILLEQLQMDTQKSCNDALKAVRGSHSNLERGLMIYEKSEQLEEIIKNKDIKELRSILKETKRGWQIADEVNVSSAPQLEFAEKVNQNTKHLHEKSNHIKDLIIKRHKYYTQSLFVFADLTEILSVQFVKYKEFNSILEDAKIDAGDNEIINQLVDQIEKISDSANYIKRQNLEKINTSYFYSEHEMNTVEMTKEEIKYFDIIIEEIEFMTETTRYPIEGSNNNITNGQLLEQLLLTALKENDIVLEYL